MSCLLYIFPLFSSSITMQKYLILGDISAYSTAFGLSNFVWNIIQQWDYLSRKTIGSQFAEAVDSISANIAEGFGRYSKKDKIKFYRYSYGSVYESFDWNKKAYLRGLLNHEQYQHIYVELKKLLPDLHSLIKFTNARLNT